MSSSPDANSDAHPPSAHGDGDKPKPSVKRLGILSRLLALMAPYTGRFILATIALFIGSGAGLLYPQALRLVVDTGITEKSLERIDLIALALVGVFVAQAALTWLRHYLMS